METNPLPRREVAVDEWKWSADQDPKFHRKNYSQLLVKHFEKLFENGTTGRVFVPLCGKTMDLIFLEEKGLEVVGLEFSKIGIEAFFEENNLTYSESTCSDSCLVVYKCKEKNITIYRGDIFDLKPELCGQFDGFWDRGSYVAINIPTQQKYTDLIFSLMKPKAKILMESITYDMSKCKGPPHCITIENLQGTFGEKCNIEVIDMIKYPANFQPDLELTIRLCFISFK
ncbi:thiopurine S-methyltransferase-like [Styela clava]